MADPTTKPITVPISGSITIPVPTSVKGDKGDKGDPGRDGHDGKDGNGVSGAPSFGVDVTTLGVTQTGPDNTPLIEAHYAKQAGPVTYFFPAGTWPLERTLRLGRDGASIRGAGRFLTTLAGGGGYPLVCFGVTEAASDGYAIGPETWPDAQGVLDSSIVGGPKWAYGFRTNGRTSAYLTCHGLSLGAFDPAAGWSYHGDQTALTVRFLVGPPPGGRLPASGALFGVGGDRDGGVPAPHLTGFWLDTASGQGAVLVEVRCEGDPPGKTRMGTFPYGDPSKSHRLAWGVDLTAGKSFGMVDGRVVPITWNAGDEPPAGSTLEKNTKDYPWQFGLPSLLSYAGTGTPTPDVVLYGLAEYAAYLPTAPVNDQAAYLDGSGPCLGYYRCNAPPLPGRSLRMENGAAAGGLPGEVLLLDTLRGNANQSGASVSDLTLERGAPGLLAGIVYDLGVSDVRARGGVQGLANIRMNGGSYYTVIRDCEASGTESGSSLYGSIVAVDNLTVRQAGATSIRLTSCGARLTGLMGAGFGPAPENFLRCYGAPGYGNIVTVEDCHVDNEEGVGLSRAAVEIDQAPYTPTGLSVRTLAVERLGPQASAIRLTGYPGGSVYPANPHLDASGIFCPADCLSVLHVDGPADVWTGTLATASPAKPVTGSAGRIGVKGP